jgi:hypothetical protein
MMGDPNKPVRSVQELLSDRSLESRFQFDDSGDASIPDFTQLAEASSSSPGDGISGVPTMGKKKQRQAERRANALKATEEEKQDNPLLNIAFIKNEKGQISPIKILEAGGECFSCSRSKCPVVAPCSRQHSLAILYFY